MFRGAVLLWGLLAADLAAQPPVAPPKANQPPKYVQFAIDGDPERMLSEFLKTKAGKEIFQQLVQDKLKDFIDQPPENIENFLRERSKGDPIFREMIERFKEDYPGLQKGNPAELGDALKKFGDQFDDKKAFAEMIAKSLEKKFGPEGISKIAEAATPRKFDDEPDVKLPKLDDFMNEDDFFDDRFGEWFADLLKNPSLQNDLAEFLKDSPDLQDAVADLMRSLQGPAANGNWMPKMPEGGIGKWNFDLKPPKMPFDLGQLPQFPTLKMPQLPRLNLPMPQFGNLGLPRLPGFGGVPNLPAAPNVSGGREWIYIGFTILAVGLAWWLLRKLDWSPRSRAAQVAELLKSLPSSITTRTELRQAFDALALARLGDKARPWNHRLIARQLGDDTSSADAAQAFASLYEIARYTPGDDRLSGAEQTAVRDSLAVLTGGAA